MRFQAAHPICCGELGCYTHFLGLGRDACPEALRAALGLGETPRVCMHVNVSHEPGFRYKDLTQPIDQTVFYDFDHFAPSSDVARIRVR